MEKTVRLAAFTGNEDIELAVSERIQWTGDFIEENDLAMPDGTVPPDDWAPAMFRPEAGMHGFNIRCTSDGMLLDGNACKNYNLPDGTGHAVFLGLEGDAGEIEAFCRKICDASGLSCHLMAYEGDARRIEKTLAGAGGPMDPDAFIALMYDPDEE